MQSDNLGTTFAEQLAEKGVQMGWDTRLVPFGKDTSAAVYSLGFANRAALSFGNVSPGDFKKNLLYNKNRIFAFVLALGTGVTDEQYANAVGQSATVFRRLPISTSLKYCLPVFALTNTLFPGFRSTRLLKSALRCAA